MVDLAWIDGEISSLAEARIPLEDRGFLLGDGVYEVIRIYSSRPFYLFAHLERLRKSAGAVKIKIPFPPEKIEKAVYDLIKKGQVRDGYVYVQVTRGCAPRDHLFPARVDPSMVLYVKEAEFVSGLEAAVAATCVTLPDERWLNCHIKTINLLPNLLARQRAFEEGALEAILYRPGKKVTEGTRANVFAVVDGVVRTHPESNLILSGVTRRIILDIIKRLSIPCREEAFTVDELFSAEEVWLTSTTMEIMPVGVIDRFQIKAAPADSISRSLIEEFKKEIAAS